MEDAPAADIINEALIEANSDIRVDHRSFRERGIDQEPTTHLGPAASEMERRGEPSERGDINRQADQVNASYDELAALETAIAEERERLAAPPPDRDAALERMQDDVAAFREAVQMRGQVADIQTADGLPWWQRTALRVFEKARELAVALSRFFRQAREPNKGPERSRDDDGGRER